MDMKKLFKILLIIVFVCVIVYFAPKLVHKCDDCEKWFIGTGYEANVIADAISDDDQIICKPCAEKQHKIGTTFGKSLEDYRRKLFN